MNVLSSHLLDLLYVTEGLQVLSAGPYDPGSATSSR